MKTGLPTKNDEVTITDLSVTYCQNSDSCEENGSLQTLEISTDDAGDGLFYIIKTDRWAFDSIQELINLLNNFEKRLKL